MYIKNRTFSAIWKIAASLIGFSGILLQMALLNDIRMFTIESNLICAVYFLIAGIRLLKDKSGDSGNAFLHPVKVCCIIMISLTFSIANTMMLDLINFTTWVGITMFILHVITPLMYLADWLLFDRKGQWTVREPLYALLFPILYFIGIMITAQFMAPDAPYRFPYDFLDYETLGIPRLIITVIFLVLIVTAAGYLFRAVDRLLARRLPEK